MVDTVAMSKDRLLLVDDNPTNLQVLFQGLKEAGYELLIAQSGEEAIATAKGKLESQDPAELEAATQELTQSLHKVAEVLYRQEAEQAPPEGAPGTDAGSAGGPSPGAADDDVIDADYTEEKGDS